MAVTITATTDTLGQILGDRAVRSVYQPIVDLVDGHVVGYEALARGPEGSALERPDLLFAEARRTGRLARLDLACRTAAVEGALEAGMGRGMRLFVNIEPEAISAKPDTYQRARFVQAVEQLDIVVEATERAMVHAPADLLGALDLVRRLGWSVAIDDVGADPASLALMPVLRPEVIKLDLKLVQAHPDREIAQIVGAVTAQAERTGALVLAEGIETPEQRDAALGMGATLGQGWLFGRPGPLPQPLHAGVQLPIAHHDRARNRSTVDAALGPGPLRRSTKPLLLEMSWHLERQALDLGCHAIVVGAFQTADRFTTATRSRYADLAQRSAFVGALGAGLATHPAPGVRGGTLRPGDPLLDEWAVAVLGPHFSAALAARDLGDRGPDHLRRFDHVLTYDRERVVEVARVMMHRIADPAS